MAANGIDRTGAAGGTGSASLIGALANLADPNTDSLIFWDDSEGAFNWATVADVTHLTDIAGLTAIDGNIIVGDGTNWVAESGATARTSLGLGTGDSPTFAGLSLTTALPVAQGGTGASNAADARTNLGLGAAATGGFATEAQQEAGTAASSAVTPAVQHYHSSAAKAWGVVSSNGTLLAGYNCSVTSNGTGIYDVSFTTALSNANYAVIISAKNIGGVGNAIACVTGTKLTTGFSIVNTGASFDAATNGAGLDFAVFGTS